MWWWWKPRIGAKDGSWSRMVNVSFCECVNNSKIFPDYSRPNPFSSLFRPDCQWCRLEDVVLCFQSIIPAPRIIGWFQCDDEGSSIDPAHVIIQTHLSCTIGANERLREFSFNSWNSDIIRRIRFYLYRIIIGCWCWNDTDSVLPTCLCHCSLTR